MSARRGVTVLELVVACLICVTVWVTLHGALSLLGLGSRSSEAESTRAMVEARVVELLMQDVRSSVRVDPLGPGSYRIVRSVDTPRGIEEIEVTWRTCPDGRVLRSVGGRPDREFAPGRSDMGSLVDARLDLEVVRDATIVQ